MTKKILSLVFVAFLLFSCKESNAEALETATPTTETVQPEATQPEQVIQTTENTEAQNKVQAQPTPAAPSNSGPFIQQQNTQNAQTAPGFSGKPNPPHGQPGHRCDVQVGAILP